jgi:hypothetical protein
MANLARSGLIVGFLGDWTLQQIVSHSDDPDLWGLRSYFATEGPVASLFVAAGMTGAFSAAFQWLSPTLDWRVAVPFTAGVDYAFRTLRLLPALDSYYQHLSVPMSMAWAVIPLGMVVAFDKMVF